MNRGDIWTVSGGSNYAGNGLRSSSRLMVDKITTIPKLRVGEHVGRLDKKDVIRLNQAVMVFLGLAVAPRAAR